MLKSLPEPDYMDVKVAEGYICLVTDDGTAAPRLARLKYCRQRGLHPLC
jgi:hypothetical protein